MKVIIGKEEERDDCISVAENEIRITTWEKLMVLQHSFKKFTLKINTGADREMAIMFAGSIENVSPNHHEKNEIWIKTVKYQAL